MDSKANKVFLLCVKIIPPKEYKAIATAGNFLDPSVGFTQHVCSAIYTESLKKDKQNDINMRFFVALDSAIFMKDTNYEVGVPLMLYEPGLIFEFHLSAYLINDLELSLVDFIVKSREPNWFKILPCQLDKSVFPECEKLNPNFISEKKESIVVTGKYKKTRMLSIIKAEKCGFKDETFKTKKVSIKFCSEMKDREITASKNLSFGTLYAENDYEADTLDLDSSIEFEIDRVFAEKDKKIPLTRFVNRTYCISAITVTIRKNRGLPEEIKKEVY